MSKIILTGAQGTGKTTILNHFKNELPVITEVVRKLAKQGVPINEKGTIDGQKAIFEQYIKEFNEHDSYISDRGLTDVIGYTLAQASLTEDKNESDKLLAAAFQMFNRFINWLNNNPDALFFYFPIEFPVVDDGVRSINEEYRKIVDKFIKIILDASGAAYIVVKGTIEERVDLIKEVIDYE